MNKIQDVYDGENVTIWKDEDMTFLSIWNVTVSFPNEDWEEIKEELKGL